jgi:hypothetical protein
MDGEGKIGTVKLAESAACTGISIYYDRQPVFALAKNFGWTKGNADAAPLAPVSKYLLNKKFFSLLLQLLLSFPVIVRGIPLFWQRRIWCFSSGHR